MGVKDGSVCSGLLKLAPWPHLHPNLASRIWLPPVVCFSGKT